MKRADRTDLIPATTALLVVFGLLTAWRADAAALGEIAVESVLNEPFFARIEVLPSSEDPQDWEIGIGDFETYEQLGLERFDYADELRATLVEARGRPPEIYVEGREPFRELFLDVVVVIRSNGDRRVRHYPVLIDFPAVSAPTAVDTDDARERRARYQPPPPQPRQPLQPTLDLDFPAGEGRYVVAPGDTLSAIAKRVAGQRPLGLGDVMDAIYGLNPDAFIRGDMNLIRAGARLTLPDLDALPSAIAASATAPGPAAGRMQTEGGEARPGPAAAEAPAASEPDDPRLELRGTPDTETLVEDLNQWLEADDRETSARAAEVRRDLAFAAAEIETYRRENEMLRSRVQGLEERVVEMERLLALQSRLIDTIDEDGEPAQPAGEPAAQAESPAPEADGDGGDAVVADVAGTESDDGGFRWILFPALAAAVLVIFGLLVLLRSAREDKKRRQRTADLTRRLRETGERDRLPEDL